MQRIIGTLIGKTVRRATRLGRSGGHALPGLVVEKLFPAYFAAMLRQLPDGVVIVTGTNGKTTTTKMIAELLTANGKRVLTNPSGSNMTRGINSALIQRAKPTGKLLYDIAVLELDEAYACQFVQQVRPHWVVALNVTRDQLDRFGEVDTAAALLGQTMNAALEGVVVNADDERLLRAAGSAKPRRLVLFGVAQALRKFFPHDAELVAVGTASQPVRATAKRSVELKHFSGQQATYTIDDRAYDVQLQLSGQHNLQNAAAALAIVHVLCPEVQPQELIAQLAIIKPAFGRGQVFQLSNGTSLCLVLVKNPAGFRQALASYLPANGPVMIAINDNIADGRDISWLWDVDFVSLKNQVVALTSGTRAADMALRLQYDECPVESVEPDLAKALHTYCQLPGDKLLLATYTAMTWLHRTLEQQTGDRQ